MYFVYVTCTQIHQVDVDNYGAKTPAYVPSIMITISTEQNVVTRLNYCVPLSGIIPGDAKIYIIRSLHSSNNGKY